MTESDIQTIRETLTHQLGIYAEDVQHKLDLVVEGQQMLSEKVDRLEVELKAEIGRVDRRVGVVHTELGQKIDAVAADLSAHRHDTEAHSVYGVRE